MFAAATTAAILAGSLTGANAVVAKTEKPDVVEENGGVENVEVDEPILLDDVAPAPMDDMAGDLVPCSQTCYYQVVAQMDWTAERHPRDFPAPIDGDEMTGAHFPPLWTVAHDSSFVLWREDDTATERMKEIAELGTGEIFLQDVEECGDSCGEGKGLECMPTSGKCAATGEVRVTEAYPYISIATMLSPSPDWFTGLDSEPLCVDGHWIPHFEKGVNAYDGGTLSGDTFRSDSEPTMPYEPIFSFGGIEPASDSIFYNDEQEEILPVGLIKLVRTHCDGPTDADGEVADDMIDMETDEMSDEESEDVPDSGCGMGGQPVCAGDDLIDREFECDHGYVSDDQGICIAYEESKKDKMHMDMGMPHMDGEMHEHADGEEPHMDGEHVEEEPHMDGDAEPEEHRRERRPRGDMKEEAEPHMDGEHVEEPHMDDEHVEEEPHMDMDMVDTEPEEHRRERRARNDKEEDAEPHMDGEHVEEEPHMDGEHIEEEEPHMDGEHVEEEPHMDGDAEPEEHRRERRARDDKEEDAEPHMDGEHIEEEPHMDMDDGEHMGGEDMPHMSEDADAEEPHMDGDAQMVPEENGRKRRDRDDKKVEDMPHMDGDAEEPHMDGEHVEEPHMDDDVEQEEPHMDSDDSMPEDGRRERRARGDKQEKAEPHMDGEHVEEEPHMDGDAEEPHMDEEHVEEEPHMDGEHVEEEPHMDGDDHRRGRRPRDDKIEDEEPHMDGEHVEEELHMDGEHVEDETHMDGEHVEDETHMDDEHVEDEPHMDGDGEHRRGRRARGTTKLHVDVSTSDSDAEIHINGDSIFGDELADAEHTEPHTDEDDEAEDEHPMGEEEEQHRGDRRPRDADEDSDNDVIENFLEDFDAGMDAQMQDGASDDAEHSDSDEHSSDDTEEHEQGSEHLEELLELQKEHDEEEHAKTSDKPRADRRGRNNGNRTRGPRKAREL